MYLNKSKKGIGWYSAVKRNQANAETEPLYINFLFKKGTEPQGETIEGDLFFIDRNGDKRMVLPFINEYNGNKRIEFRIMGGQAKVENSLPFYEEPKKDVALDPEDLPFY